MGDWQRLMDEAEARIAEKRRQGEGGEGLLARLILSTYAERAGDLSQATLQAQEVVSHCEGGMRRIESYEHSRTNWKEGADGMRTGTISQGDAFKHSHDKELFRDLARIGCGRLAWLHERRGDIEKAITHTAQTRKGVENHWSMWACDVVQMAKLLVRQQVDLEPDRANPGKGTDHRGNDLSDVREILQRVLADEKLPGHKQRFYSSDDDFVEARLVLGDLSWCEGAKRMAKSVYRGYLARGSAWERFTLALRPGSLTSLRRRVEETRALEEADLRLLVPWKRLYSAMYSCFSEISRIVHLNNDTRERWVGDLRLLAEHIADDSAALSTPRGHDFCTELLRQVVQREVELAGYKWP